MTRSAQTYRVNACTRDVLDIKLATGLQNSHAARLIAIACIRVQSRHF